MEGGTLREGVPEICCRYAHRGAFRLDEGLVDRVVVAQQEIDRRHAFEADQGGFDFPVLSPRNDGCEAAFHEIRMLDGSIDLFKHGAERKIDADERWPRSWSSSGLNDDSRRFCEGNDVMLAK